MRKLFLLMFCLTGLLTLHAQAIEFANIESIMEDNSLRDVSNRYTSVLSFFFPEDTTRLGMTLANRQLNIRTEEREKQAEQALQSIQIDIDSINSHLLSENKQMDFDLFQRQVNQAQWDLAQHNLTKNPLYYSNVFDAIYDLFYLRQIENPRQRNSDVRARLMYLPQTTQEAQKNLKEVSPALASLAMEKIYNAYISFDEIAAELIKNTPDEFAAQDAGKTALDAKDAMREMFEFFKTFSQQEAKVDFRLGKTTYEQLLSKYYDVNLRFDKLTRSIDQNFDAAQHALSNMLYPFAKTAEDDGVTVVEGDDEAVIIEAPKTPAKKKKQKREYIPPTAGQYFAIAQHFEAPDTENMIALVSQDAAEVEDLLVNKSIIPSLKDKISIKPLPAYYAYSQPYVYIGADGFPDFFLREPSGNALAKQETLAKEFNTPVRKVFVSENIIPGYYYQTKQTENLSRERRYYPSKSLQNGWKAFALQLARDNHYLLTDEELLVAAWADYRRAIAAVVDMRLQTRQYSYEDALKFLVEENSFPQEEAEALLKELILNPGLAVGTIMGQKAIQDVYSKYLKKLNKKFTHADLIALFMEVGNVAPSQLEKEMDRVYKEKYQK